MCANYCEKYASNEDGCDTCNCVEDTSDSKRYSLDEGDCCAFILFSFIVVAMV